MVEQEISSILIRELGSVKTNLEDQDLLSFSEGFKQQLQKRSCQFDKKVLNEFRKKIKKDPVLLFACFKSLLCFFELIESRVFNEKEKVNDKDQFHLSRSKWVVFSDLLLVIIHSLILRTSYPDPQKIVLLDYFTDLTLKSISRRLNKKSGHSMKKWIHDQIEVFRVNF